MSDQRLVVEEAGEIDGENDSFHIDELPTGLGEEEKEEERARSA